MSGFINHLVSSHVNPAGNVLPRLKGRFESFSTIQQQSVENTLGEAHVEKSSKSAEYDSDLHPDQFKFSSDSKNLQRDERPRNNDDLNGSLEKINTRYELKKTDTTQENLFFAQHDQQQENKPLESHSLVIPPPLSLNVNSKFKATLPEDDNLSQTRGETVSQSTPFVVQNNQFNQSEIPGPLPLIQPLSLKVSNDLGNALPKDNDVSKSFDQDPFSQSGLPKSLQRLSFVYGNQKQLLVSPGGTNRDINLVRENPPEQKLDNTEEGDIRQQNVDTRQTYEIPVVNAFRQLYKNEASQNIAIEPPSIIKVNIGRIDVRAVTQQPSTHEAVRPKTGMSLNDFLKNKNGSK